MQMNNATLASANLEGPLAVILPANSSQVNPSADPSQLHARLKPVASWISPLAKFSVVHRNPEKLASFARLHKSPRELAMASEPALPSPNRNSFNDFYEISK